MLRRGAICAVWLLCALIVAASLDSVPDPPAIQQRGVSLQSLHQLADLSSVAPLDHAVIFEQFPSAGCRTFWSAPDHRLLVASKPLLRRAADPSPPALAS